MASLDILIQRGEVCHRLRTKTMFYETEDDTSGQEGPCWCVLTQSLQGPDGEIADPNHCRPGRSCCETA